MKINIQNLKSNLLEIEETVHADFLQHAYQKYYPDPVRVKVVLDKFGSEFKLSIHARTKGLYECDRCLSEFKHEFVAKQEQIIQVGPGSLSNQEDVLQLPAGTTEIEIDTFLQEIFILNHPVKTLCREECKGLCPGCGTDLNYNSCTCGNERIDPRWEELKKLIR